jgi:hypothetical protein
MYIDGNISLNSSQDEKYFRLTQQKKINEHILLVLKDSDDGLLSAVFFFWTFSIVTKQVLKNHNVSGIGSIPVITGETGERKPILWGPLDWANPDHESMTGIDPIPET